MLEIYHNPKCSKSRQGVELLKNSGKEFQIIEYMKNPLTKKELESMLKKLKMKPIELVRQKEKIWMENFKGKELSDAEIIQAMLEYPNLIERPIVVNEGKAVVGRPTELINDIL